MESIKNFTAKAKLTSNMTTLIFAAYMAYTFSLWHKVAGFDRLINIVILILIMAVNIKFYLIYANLNDLKSSIDKKVIERTYKYEKREYNNLIRASLWMGIFFIVGRLIFS